MNPDDAVLDPVAFGGTAMPRGPADGRALGRSAPPATVPDDADRAGGRVIHKFSLKTQHRWGRGAFQVQVMIGGGDRPVAYCDGTPEDLEELRSIAQEEGVELGEVHRRVLRSGKEIWTLGAPKAEPPPED